MEKEKWRRNCELYEENNESLNYDLYRKALFEAFGDSEEEANKNAIEFVNAKRLEYINELCDFD